MVVKYFQCYCQVLIKLIFNYRYSRKINNIVYKIINFDVLLHGICYLLKL